jgi:signal peptidase I
MDWVEKLKRIYFLILDSLQAILIVCGFFLVLYAFVLRPHEVSGQSMFPTYHDKEILLSNLLAIKANDFKRGDVVVFNAPYEKDKLYIKRIIGMPGDRVMVSNGSVFLNGALLDESLYLKPDVKTFGGAFFQDGVEHVVPQGTIVVFGDNRPFSSDSREWGFLDQTKLIGKSLVRVWPTSKFGFIINPF